MAFTHRPAVHRTAGITHRLAPLARHLAPLARHLALAAVVDGIAIALHAHLSVRVVLALLGLAGHRLRHRRRL